MILEAPEAITTFIDRLLQAGLEVWLIGSRANAEAKETSDWDFFVFGSESFLDSLGREPSIPSLDLMVVVDAKRFQRAWPSEESGRLKKWLTLTSWNWTKQSEEEATYEGSNWETGDVSTKRSFRIRQCRRTA